MRRVSKGLKDFKQKTTKAIHFPIYFVPVCSFNDFRKTKNSRVYSVCVGLALLSQNYCFHLTSTLYKPDTSSRRTIGVGPDGVRLRQSWLYPKSRTNFISLLSPDWYSTVCLDDRSLWTGLRPKAINGEMEGWKEGCGGSRVHLPQPPFRNFIHFNLKRPASTKAKEVTRKAKRKERKRSISLKPRRARKSSGKGKKKK